MFITFLGNVDGIDMLLTYDDYLPFLRHEAESEWYLPRTSTPFSTPGPLQVSNLP